MAIMMTVSDNDNDRDSNDGVAETQKKFYSGLRNWRLFLLGCQDSSEAALLFLNVCVA